MSPLFEWAGGPRTVKWEIGGLHEGLQEPAPQVYGILATAARERDTDARSFSQSTADRGEFIAIGLPYPAVARFLRYEVRNRKDDCSLVNEVTTRELPIQLGDCYDLVIATWLY